MLDVHSGNSEAPGSDGKLDGASDQGDGAQRPDSLPKVVCDALMKELLGERGHRALSTLRAMDRSLRNMFDNYTCFEGDLHEAAMARFMRRARELAIDELAAAGMTAGPGSSLADAMTAMLDHYRAINSAIVAEERELTKAHADRVMAAVTAKIDGDMSAIRDWTAHARASEQLLQGLTRALGRAFGDASKLNGVTEQLIRDATTAAARRLDEQRRALPPPADTNPEDRHEAYNAWKVDDALQNCLQHFRVCLDYRSAFATDEADHAKRASRELQSMRANLENVLTSIGVPPRERDEVIDVASTKAKVLIARSRAEISGDPAPPASAGKDIATSPFTWWQWLKSRVILGSAASYGK